MQKKTLLYFTASAVATADELADIKALDVLTKAPFDVRVMNAEVADNMGVDPATSKPILRPADYAEGAVPDAYSELPKLGINLPFGAALVLNGDEIEIGDTTYRFTVFDGVITNVEVLPDQEGL